MNGMLSEPDNKVETRPPKGEASREKANRRVFFHDCPLTAKYLLMYFFIVFVGFVSLVAVYCIPVSTMQQEIQESIPTLESQGNYYSMIGNSVQSTVDNFTIAIMLNIASHDDGDAIQRALLGAESRYVEGGDSGDNVSMLADGYYKPANTTYTRYWHGWLVVLKPLLVFLNLTQIQSLFLFLLFAAASIVVISLARFGRCGPRVALCFSLAIALINLACVGVSLPFAFSFFIAFVACMVVMRLIRRFGPSTSNLGLLFFVVGALTAYFDFLDTPIVTLGLPLAVLLVSIGDGIEKMQWKKLIGLLIVCCATWALGYGLLWVTKWVIATLVTGRDVISEGVGQFENRTGMQTSSSEGGITFSIFDVFRRNFETLLPKWSISVVAVCAVAYVFVFVKTKGRFSKKFTLSMLLVCLLPLVWYIVASNHSYVHYWITYRDLVVSVFGILVILASGLPVRKDGTSGSELQGLSDAETEA